MKPQKPIKKISDKQRKRNQMLSKIKKSLPQYCVKCGSTYNLTLDHIINRGSGGKKDIDSPENLQILCFNCHREKTDR